MGDQVNLRKLGLWVPVSERAYAHLASNQRFGSVPPSSRQGGARPGQHTVDGRGAGRKNSAPNAFVEAEVAVSLKRGNQQREKRLQGKQLSKLSARPDKTRCARSQRI